MSERDMDDLFREFSGDKPYCGSCVWKAVLDRNRQAQQIFQDFARRDKNQEARQEQETSSQLAALGCSFSSWCAPRWHG